jgi:RimJ/RimL family protein N-acetyltransferase
MNRAQIGVGPVRHARLSPRPHRFAYPAFFFMLPMRSLRAQPDPLLARNRAAWISFHDRDHGDGGPDALAWAEALLQREGVKADGEIWLIYPFSYAGEAFDQQFNLMLSSDRPRRCYVIQLADEIVGMTAWIEHGAPGHSIEIGNSYIVPRLRGTGFNRRVKTLLLNHAFAQGLVRVGFKVDEINQRSQAAVLKLGCTKEGVLRAERVTWTGRLRDTGVFSILADEWAAQKALVDA